VVFLQHPLGLFLRDTLFVKDGASRNRFTLDCEKYLCQLEEFQTRSLTLFPKNDPSLQIELSFNDNVTKQNTVDYFQIQLEHFVSQIRRAGLVRVDGWFAAKSVRLIEAMYQSRSQLDEPWSLYINRQTSNEG